MILKEQNVMISLVHVYVVISLVRVYVAISLVHVNLLAFIILYVLKI